MRQRVVPLLAPVAKARQTAAGCIETRARGLAVLNSPLLNKGTAFIPEERQELGLTGNRIRLSVYQRRGVRC